MRKITKRLVLVSIWFRGNRHSFLTFGTVGNDGKTRVPYEEIQIELSRMGVRPGEMIGIGI